EAVIDHIEDITERLNIPDIKRPWLPPLPEMVYQSELIETDFNKLWTDQPKEVELTLGLKDVPEDQYQGPMTLKLKQAGHIALIGSPGYGRTNFLHNVIFDVARHYRPDQAHMYLFDFGTNGLMPVSDVPHVADYFTVDQEDKIAKAIKQIHQIIAERKKLLSQERVINIDQYNKETGKTVPNVFIIIDNYDTVKESPFVEDYEEMMAKVTREGLALGVYIILTGSRSSAVKSSIFTNIKTRIALYLFENNELTNIIGSYKKGVKDIKGRAAINDDNFTQFQIAQPFEVKEGQTYNSCIKDEIAQMNEHYVGEYPAHIPMMPEKVLREELEAKYDFEKIILEDHKLPVGLDFEDVELVSLDVTKPSILSAKVPKDLEILNDKIFVELEKLKTSATTILIDAEMNMSNKKDMVKSYYSSVEELKFIKQGFVVEIEKRINGEKATDDIKVVFINNIKAFINSTGITEKDIKLILSDGPKVNVYVIISSMYNDIIGTYDRETKLTRQIINQAIIATRLYDQDFAPSRSTNREPMLKPYEMHKFENNEYQKIKIMI
ncbi:type VII secretion protein EssC, partial [Staphylococcus epidermidis]